jgi:CRP/FNR family transcriptional regulator, cyclic AMP receptor protein
MSGSPYEASAETIHPCQVTFVRRQDFMSFINKYPEQAVIQQLTTQYRYACEQLRTMGLSPTAHGKLARLLLQWSRGARDE